MSTKPVSGTESRQSDRQDAWWIEPLFTVLSLGLFGLYAFWVALNRQHFEFGPYLSPFYSIPLPGVHAKDLDWLPISPAFLVLWIPLGFRVTCYYYRKAYYRAFFWDPPACAVPELRKAYKGERAFPFVLNNLHRYFWYLSIPVVAFLWYDAIRAFFFEDGFGIGLGSLIMLGNVILLSYYTFSCHAWRHLAGGCLNCMSKHKARYTLWQRITRINESHGFWGVTSMLSVWFTDVYIRLCSMGTISDIRLL